MADNPFPDLSLKTDGTPPPDPMDAPALYEDLLKRRVFGFLIDSAVIVVLSLLAYVALGVAGIMTFGLLWIFLPLVAVVLPILYTAVTTAGPDQATPGMRLCGVKLYALDGKPVTFTAALIRAIIFYVLMGVTSGFAPLVCFFQRHRRGLHDILSDTAVFRADAPSASTAKAVDKR